jgi:uncharacterized damage-inducible protein DinB
MQRGEFLDYFTRIRHRTRRVVTLIPPDQLEWTYRPGKFTLGDLVRHIAAIERFMFAENVVGRPSSYPGHDVSLAAGYEETVAYFEQCHEESMQIFSSLTDEELQRPCITPGGAELAKWKWLRAMIEHEIHHRGQIYLYLSMLGIDTPPLYGLTSEEVQRRSERSVGD